MNDNYLLLQAIDDGRVYSEPHPDQPDGIRYFFTSEDDDSDETTEFDASQMERLIDVGAVKVWGSEGTLLQLTAYGHSELDTDRFNLEILQAIADERVYDSGHTDSVGNTLYVYDQAATDVFDGHPGFDIERMTDENLVFIGYVSGMPRLTFAGDEFLEKYRPTRTPR